jgi:hypothetical protein
LGRLCDGEVEKGEEKRGYEEERRSGHAGTVDCEGKPSCNDALEMGVRCGENRVERE